MLKFILAAGAVGAFVWAWRTGRLARFWARVKSWLGISE